MVGVQVVVVVPHQVWHVPLEVMKHGLQVMSPPSLSTQGRCQPEIQKSLGCKIQHLDNINLWNGCLLEGGQQCALRHRVLTYPFVPFPL